MNELGVDSRREMTAVFHLMIKIHVVLLDHGKCLLTFLVMPIFRTWV